MRTVEIKIYTFDELSPEAKQITLNRYSDINTSYDWWTPIYESAKTVGLIIESFDLDKNKITGDFIDSSYETAKAIIKERGDICKKYKISQNFIKEWDNLVAENSDGIQIDVVIPENYNTFDEKADELEEQFLKDVFNDFLNDLKKEYEYLTSEEAIIETLKMNQYEFTEDGRIY